MPSVSMALEAPVWSSSGSLQFQLNGQGGTSAHSEMERINSPYRFRSPPPPATDSGLLRPHSVNRIPSNAMSPSDIVGPSPVTSNGTEITEIDDEIAEEVEKDQAAGSRKRRLELLSLATNVPESVRQPNPDEAVSVIHAPESFASWTSTETTNQSSQPSETSSPKDNVSQVSSSSYHSSPPQPHRPPISTNIRPVRYSLESSTPRAQDLQDILSESGRLRSNSSLSLEKIDEQPEAEVDDDDDDYDAFDPLQQSGEVTALRTALGECWLLCKTMATLSSSQRARTFRNSGTPDPREKAWGACWKLCQCLYDSQGDKSRPELLALNLELCRDFCQTLFDVREKQDETSDSILRVSFELNNHLYTAQGLNLPDQFQKRTLDFYTTLCHRLMKQRGELQGEADQLLRACWNLTETLFSLWQIRLDGRPPDEESLGTAVQACWDLCDLFKRSCKQIRPDRAASWASQASFLSLSSEQNGRESRQSNRSRHSKRESVKSIRSEDRPRKSLPVPETPVTEFEVEDTAVSPERSPTVPNLMVLGTTSDRSRSGRWSSSASNLSSYSHNSNRTSSTATTTAAGAEDANLTRARVLVLRAAMNLGFDRDDMNDPKTAVTRLQKFVQDLPAGAFGPLSIHTNLLQQYKNSVIVDAFIPRPHAIPPNGKRVTAVEMAKSIQMLGNSSSRYGYLRDLFKLVFQFPVDEVDLRRNVSIIV